MPAQKRRAKTSAATAITATTAASSTTGRKQLRNK
jgi:hypothetical protein